MLDNYEYNSYLSKTLAFARTIVIKCEDIAILDNRAMELYWGIKTSPDKSKWRYYMNLNGEYHETDTMMQVQSLDNGETIMFTKENLDIHLATKRAYREGSYYFSRLTEKYPGQSELIKGIINPIPQKESIPAKNYQILRYNTDYVLWNEFQLVPELQRHVYNMVETYFKTEYIFTDDLMLTTLLANLHGSLFSATLQIREEADGTRYVHEFHIWSRLNSLGLSSIYKQVLDSKQVMWLYRNLGYVLRQQGKRKTFDELVDIVLTHRSIPLSRHIALRNTEFQLEDIKPTPMFESQPVNQIGGLGASYKLMSVEELILKELPLAMDNEELQSESEERAKYLITTDLHSDIPTKVLESTMVDITERNPYSMMRVLHTHWIYMAKMGLYDINHDFQNARTGKNFRLKTKEAYILWAYLVDEYNDNVTTDIGAYPYYRARRAIVPNYQTLMSLGSEPMLSETICKDIVKTNPPMARMISPDAFYGTCKEIFNADWNQRKLLSIVPNMYWEVQRGNAIEACYETGLAKLNAKDQTYHEWLDERDLSFEDYSKEEMLDLAWAIWKKVTGWENAAYITLGDQQRGLINLMKDLTSYTVQYIGSTDNSFGNYQLGYHNTMESTAYFNDDGPGTGLENDMELILPGANKIITDISLETEFGPFSVEGRMIESVEMESIQCGYLPSSGNLFRHEVEQPDMFPVMLCMGMTMVGIPNS